MEGNANAKHWSADDRPRDKLLSKGVSALSDAEIISLLLSTGTKELSAVDIAKSVLHLSNNCLRELGKLSFAEMVKIKGIGTAKAVILIAALELGRRRKEAEAIEKEIIASSRDAYHVFEPVLSDIHHEEFWILLLKRNNAIIKRQKVSQGGVHGTVVDPKIIFKHAIESLASSIVLCHNHPSGNVNPSPQDVELTRKIVYGGKVIEIAVLDHIIVGEKKFFSFSDEGIMV